MHPLLTPLLITCLALLTIACGDNKTEGYAVAQPGTNEAIQSQILGSWQMIDWNGEHQKLLHLDAVWMQFNRDGSWHWSAQGDASMQRQTFGGSGQWRIEAQQLTVLNTRTTNTTEVLFRGNDMIFTTDPVIRKNGTQPGPSRYTRIPVERLINVIGVKNEADQTPPE